MPQKIQPLRIKPISAEGEAEQRYKEALKVMKRIVKARGRASHEDGETLDEAVDAAQEILDIEKLEKDIFGTPETNPNWPAPKPEKGDRKCRDK